MLNCCILAINKKISLIKNFKAFLKQTYVVIIICLLITDSLTIFILVEGLGVRNLVKFLTFRKERLLCESC
jgi:hypothetical protein